MALTEPIRDKEELRRLADYYLERKEMRNYLLIVMGVQTALRVCDLLRLTWEDVYDFVNRRFRRRVSIIEKKTKKVKTFILNERAIAALNALLPESKRGGVLFASRKGKNKAISRQQAYRIIRAAGEALEFTARVSCHSLRKTFGYLAWKVGGVEPLVIMRVFNHSSLAVTQHYLGITQDEVDDCYHRFAALT